MKLFCFPYAGGSSLIYKDWQAYFGKKIIVKAIEMPGKGKRIIEPCYLSMDEAVKDILQNIESDLKCGSYCLFGHSMGSRIVHCVLQEILDRQLPKPEHVFLSGSKPPHLKDEDKNTHLLPDDEFIEVLKDYGGTPAAFFENRELVDFFLPILRNDFKLASFSSPKDSIIDPFEIDITVLFGNNEDNLTSDEAEEWRQYTSKDFNIHCITGSHFFINENPKEVLSIIENTVLSMVSA